MVPIAYVVNRYCFFRDVPSNGFLCRIMKRGDTEHYGKVVVNLKVLITLLAVCNSVMVMGRGVIDWMIDLEENSICFWLKCHNLAMYVLPCCVCEASKIKAIASESNKGQGCQIYFINGQGVVRMVIGLNPVCGRVIISPLGLEALQFSYSSSA